MTSMEILEAMFEIVIPLPDVRLWPWKDQDKLKGSSPSDTTQDSWPKEPSFMTPLNSNGWILGGSGTKEFVGKSYKMKLFEDAFVDLP